jgi:hypothetical protein
MKINLSNLPIGTWRPTEPKVQEQAKLRELNNPYNKPPNITDKITVNFII